MKFFNINFIQFKIDSLAYFWGMKVFYKIVMIVFAAAASQLSYAQRNAGGMDSVFNWQAAHGMLMGNLLVAEKGILVYQRCFGYQDIPAKIRNSDSSAFALASIAKVFTSTAILQLKEKGLLQLDDPFCKYFPQFAYPKITIRHLLTHTSGLPEYELFDSLAKAQPTKIFTNQDIIPALKLWNKPLYFKPGTDWRYSSMNFCLLVLLIEKLSGTDFQHYLAANIFKLAGMQQTYVDNLLISRKNKYRTHNYEYPALTDSLLDVDDVAAEHNMVYNYGGFTGQGSLTCTANDLLLFDKAFFSFQLISRKSVDEALTPATFNNGRKANAIAFTGYGASYYGLGWFIQKDTTGGRIVYHPGGRPGVGTIYAHNITKNQTVILLENMGTGEVSASSASAVNLINGKQPLEQKVSLARIYAVAICNKGPEPAAKQLDSLKSDTTHYQLNVDDWMAKVRDLLTAGKRDLAVVAVKKGSETFPDASVMSEAYGDVLNMTGQKQEAITYYQKAITQDHKNKTAKEKLARMQSGK